MDSIPDWLSITLIIVLVMLSAFFNSSETSFACLNRYKYMAEADSGKKSAKLILRLSDKFETTLISTLVGNNVVSILISTISTFLFLSLFQGRLPDATVSLIASIIMAIVLFFFGDTIPKFVGKKIPDAIVHINCYPLAFFIILFYPVSLFFRGISYLVHKAFRAKPEVTLTGEDFQSYIDDFEEMGVFEENESEIVQNAMDFSITPVREVLTPRDKMNMVNMDGLTTEALLEKIKSSKFSRIPVYYQRVDNIKGVLVVKNYLNAYFQNPSTSYKDFVQPAYFVSPRIRLEALLDGFKNNHTQMAIVRYQGKVLGMVTMEDVLEELVGSIDERTIRRTVK